MPDKTLSSPVNLKLGNLTNNYYNTITNAAFYAQSAAYLYQYYWTRVRVWDQWLSGWVEGFHGDDMGILPTGIGDTIVTKIADLVWDAGITFRSTATEPDESLRFISNEWAVNSNFRANLKDVIKKAEGLGNGLFKLNADADGELWVDAIAGNRFFVDLNARGNIVKCRSFVNIFTQQGASNDQKNSFALMEERYYEGGKPKVVYNIYKLTVANVFTSNNMVSLDYKSLPSSVKDSFRKDYRDVMLGKPQDLPLDTIGCYLFKATPYIHDIPNVKLGESVLSKCLNYLMAHDFSFSEMFNDAYISRGKILVPLHMQQNSKSNGYFSGLDDFIFTKVQNQSDNEQSPTVFMPKMRVADLKAYRDSIKEDIAAAIGVSTESLFPNLVARSGSVTATEIESTQTNTNVFITNTRELFEKPLRDLMNDVLAYYKMPQTVDVDFLPLGGANKTINVDNITKLSAAGLVSTKQAVRELNPSATEQQIEEMVDNIKEEKVPEMSQKVDNEGDSVV